MIHVLGGWIRKKIVDMLRNIYVLNIILPIILITTNES